MRSEVKVIHEGYACAVFWTQPPQNLRCTIGYRLYAHMVPPTFEGLLRQSKCHAPSRSVYYSALFELLVLV